MKKQKPQIGKWYTCAYNPKIVTKLCSVKPFEVESEPMKIYQSEDKNMILLRDVVQIPSPQDGIADEKHLISTHPLLHSIYFPLYCEFYNKEWVEVCFARPRYSIFGSEIQTPFTVLAVHNGLDMCWLDEIPDYYDGILRKEEFPFIKTIAAAEAAHYHKHGIGPSLDQVNARRAHFYQIPTEPMEDPFEPEVEEVSDDKVEETPFDVFAAVVSNVEVAAEVSDEEVHEITNGLAALKVKEKKKVVKDYFRDAS